MCVRVLRPTPAPLARFGRSCCGVAETDLDLPTGQPMAGYSTDGRVARGTSLPLRARAFWLEDDHGEAVALVAADLMSGTRYLWEATAAMTAPRLGLPRERLLVAGTHTHTGPAGIYGQPLYDTIAGARPGFRPRLARALASQLAQAVLDARAAARPARMGSAEGRLWGTIRQASPSAFRRNPEATAWTAPGMPGHGAPAGLGAGHLQVDPRLRVLSWTDPAGRLLAVLAVARGHNTALGHSWDRYDGDWYGRCCARAADALGAPVAMLAGPGADCNVCADDLDQGAELAERAAASVSPELVRTAIDAAAEAHPFRLRLRFCTAAPDQLDGFADEPCFGLPALGGAMDSRSALFRLHIARPGQVSEHFARQHPQHPKKPALRLAQELLRGVLSPPPVLPFHLLQIGGHLLATVPFEPTATAGLRVENALLKATAARSCSVVGYTNAYAGYLVTAEEFTAQEYEGASTLWGRHQARAIRDRLVALHGEAPPTPTGGAARFDTLRLGPFVSAWPW